MGTQTGLEKFEFYEFCLVTIHKAITELSTWSRVLLEKQVVTQLVKNPPRVLWKPKVH